MRLADLMPETGAADGRPVLRLRQWAATDGLTLYPHRDDAIVDLLTGANTIITTPTGSGKT